jgi:hypothetical protein
MIRKFLDCSTSHLPREFRVRLWGGVGPLTEIGEDEHHRWVYVDEHTLDPERVNEVLDDRPLPEPVRKIIRHALDSGANVICFDPDGPELEGDFEWFPDDDDDDTPARLHRVRRDQDKNPRN